MLKKAILILLILCLIPVSFGALTDNLVGYWTMNSNSSDSTNKVLNVNVTLITFNSTNGKLSNGSGYNATTSGVYLANPTALKINESMSVSFWIKGASPGAANKAIISKGGINSASDAEFYFFHYSGGYVDFGVSRGTLFATNSTRIYDGRLFDNNWHFIVLTFNTSDYARIWRDGVLENTSVGISYYSKTSTKLMSFGAIETTQSATRRDSFIGALDEIGIWSKALTSSEITYLYNSSSGSTYPFEPPASVNDTCTYSGTGVWTINISDNCTLNNYLQVNNSIVVTGTNGTLTINNTILGKNISMTPTAFNRNNFIVRVLQRAGVMFGAIK